MNKTDRLLAIVLELQRKERQRAEDLAELFETSKRTIYRDILALCEAGVPIISVPGQGYSLMEGYFLPPLSFTTEEATMLLLGSDFMAQNFDAQYREAAHSASRKIDSALPATLRNDVQYLRNHIRFIGSTSSIESREHQLLQQLRRALLDGKTIRFRYYTRHRRDEEDSTQVREVDPYSLVYLFRAWHLTAYCHLRQAMRIFRLERIEELELLQRTFIRPANVHPGPGEQEQARGMHVRVLFDKEVARWVREGRSYYVTSEEETSDGLLVTLMIRHESEIIQWLLSWGSHVRVIEPASLRELMAAEVRQMLAQYQIDSTSSANKRY